METPSSSRRITRSQAQAMAAENTNSNNNSISISSRRENEDSQKGVLKSRQREKSALIDITNGSPIVGLAMGSFKTPSSTYSKNRIMIENSQSGESLLRGQVKTLLQKVEEEAAVSKILLECKPSIHKHGGFVNYPMAVLAPTPANTPQVSDFSASNHNGFESFTVSPVAENFNFSQMLNEIINVPNPQQHNDETDENNVITRSLFMDFSDSSDCTSVLTYQGCENKSSSVDSDASVWSVQVNVSTSDEYKDEDYEENYEDVEELDELCEEMSKISVNNGAKFTGKHTRYVYNSDGELEGEEESSSSSSSSTSVSGILRLKGLPTPKGKHLRFQEESEEEERGV